jgi:SAM-dependent methyltransferase
VLARATAAVGSASAGLHGPLQALRRWPAPALLAWLLCAGFDHLLRQLGWPALAAFGGAGLLGLTLSLVLADRGASRLRVVVLALGYPLAAGVVATLATLGRGGPLAALWWLLPLAALALLYPWRTWGDAPLFPTEAGALDGVPELLPLPAGARLLDAGCGAGDGLRALCRAWPQARVEGIEWSWPIAALARLRCRGAHVHRGDMWAQSWAGYDLVYLFQRPETMGRALAKARAEMPAGAWLVSLEFAARDGHPYARLHTPGGKPVWIYRLPAEVARPRLAARRCAPAPLRAGVTPAAEATTAGFKAATEQADSSRQSPCSAGSLTGPGRSPRR